MQFSQLWPATNVMQTHILQLHNPQVEQGLSNLWIVCAKCISSMDPCFEQHNPCMDCPDPHAVCTCMYSVTLIIIYNYIIFLTESVVLYNSAQYYGSWPYTDTYRYSCSSSSTSLTNCSKNSVSSSLSSYCNSNDQVGLWCMTLPQTGRYVHVHIECMNDLVHFSVY